jgi:hypothetical protein
MRSTIIALVSLATGCSSVTSVRGSVRTIGTGPDATARPVAGARVTVQCRERDALEVGLTDASGRFGRDFAEPISNACWIVTEKEGLAPEKVRVLDACAFAGRYEQSASHAATACFVVVVTAHLSPRPMP